MGLAGNMQILCEEVFEALRGRTYERSQTGAEATNKDESCFSS
jgi:hypothetical protein